MLQFWINRAWENFGRMRENDGTKKWNKKMEQLEKSILTIEMI